MEPDFLPIGADRRVTGNYDHFPLPAPVAERLLLKGERVPAAFDAADAVDVAPEREAS